MRTMDTSQYNGPPSPPGEYFSGWNVKVGVQTGSHYSNSAATSD